MSLKINKKQLDDCVLTLIRDPKTKEPKSVVTLYNLKIGAVEKKADIIASGDLKIYGASSFHGGATGALVLPSGAPAIRAGANVTIAKNADGSIRVDAAADNSSLTEEFAAVPGLVSSLSAQVSSLASTVSAFASSLGTMDNSISYLQSSFTEVQTTTNSLVSNVGSLNSFVTSTSSSLDTRVTQVSSSLDGRITLVSGSLVSLSNSLNSLDTRVTQVSSSIDSSVSLISGSLSSLSGSLSSLVERFANLKGGLGVALVMNEQLSGERNGLNKTFNLSHSPSPVSSLMVFLNGQLLTGGNGSDFVTIGDEITLSQFIRAPEPDDVAVAMYSYEVPVSSYSINEPSTITVNNMGEYEIELANPPSPHSSLMLFMNGQLLTPGETNDYIVSGSVISLESSLVDISVSRFFATYSY